MEKQSVPRLAIPLLMVLLVSTVASFVYVEATPGMWERTGRIRGWDFQQFYVAGLMLVQGQADSLYDADRFQAVQHAVLPVPNLVFFPLYPPTTALLAVPLALLPYIQAMAVWRLVSIACFAIAGWMLVRDSDRSPAWRATVVLAVATCYPLFIALRAGQISPILLLVTVAGLALHRREQPIRGGLVLSLLMLKPQFAAGMMLWLLLRRDWRTCAGLIGGIVLQMAVVAVAIQPAIVADYVWSTSLYVNHSQLYDFPDGWVHSLSGVLKNLLTSLGLVGAGYDSACKAVHLVVLAVVAVSAALTFWRSPAGRECPAESDDQWRYDHSMAVLFMLLLTPHLLLYDLVLLLVPMACLLATARWRLGVLIFFATSALVMPLHAWTDVSVVPVVLVAVLFRLMFWLPDGAPVRLLTALTARFRRAAEYGAPHAT